ncbi:adenylyltransferase [Ahniella affigens]|uniref:Adenylyl-sulfate kinase n=1 Tax=Ahniella affigens TaxID=2021234 RepID=A0A2P1PLP6_9GAMM|nr:bifunctional sulfate adenylyltransferase/adenylylsulfate kinase [Ahniella affigens]AVP95759.1 adenylyltransferase [Ahniella affigens]
MSAVSAAVKTPAGANLPELNTPYGGSLRDLLLPADAALALKARIPSLPSVDLTDRQLCDLELLLNGAFSPLQGFLNQNDYESVVTDLRLADGTLWPLPITLDVSEAVAEKLSVGAELALRDAEGTPLAVLDVESIYRPDLAREAELVFGTQDALHPAVADLQKRTQPVYLGGKLRGLALPRHFDFEALRETPAQVRADLEARGWEQLVAFQTRNPIHRAHQELTVRAAAKAGGNVLLQPVVGRTKPGDVDHYTRVRCYQAILKHYPKGTVKLSLLPLAMRMAGPREAVLHAIIRKNYGASHFIVGRDHAGPGNDSTGKPFYEPYAAQELLVRHQQEIGIKVLPFPALVYASNRNTYVAQNELKADDVVADISGTELRRRLVTGESIPDWFTYPEVAEVLRARYPAKGARGGVVFFTGLSGSGKSTIANALIAKLSEQTARSVTLLDGDLVRKHLSKGLGFSKEDRSANVQRIGFVAAEVARHGGLAVCAPIAPYADDRKAVRDLVQGSGAAFIEIHVATSLEICEARDRKGLYAQARAGKLKQFTGIDDPYEAPEKPELRFDTDGQDPGVLAAQIVEALKTQGVIA